MTRLWTLVVEGTGEAATETGGEHNNDYCIIVRVRDGKFSEIREHLDSERVTAVFGK
jgi:ketosteroid isomerase-like protein